MGDGLAASLGKDCGSKLVQLNGKPCKQYNEKIVTPHLI